AITFDSPVFQYSLVSGSGGALSLNNGAGNAASITVDNGGGHTIAAPVTIAGTAVNISTAGGTTLTISGNISGSGALNKSGSGTLVLSASANVYSGNTSVTSGVLQALGSGALSSNSNISLS